MGFFSNNEDIKLENADLDCEPQNELATIEEVAKIDDWLDTGEKVHFLEKGEGFYVDGKQKHSVGATRMAATDKRVVIKLGGKLGGGFETKSIRYDEINAVGVTEASVLSTIDIDTQSARYEVGAGGFTSTDSLNEMAKFIRQKSSKNDKKSSTDDPFDKLEKLRDLRDDGIISEDEFNKKKAEILDEI